MSKPVVKNAGQTRRVSGKRVVVTGGCGFLGSHLVDTLLARDKTTQVICIDSCYSGDRMNIAHHLNDPRFEFIRHDVSEPIFGIECDEIYHLACPASPVFYQADGIMTIKANVLGTMNMLGVAKRCGARLLLTSTSEVYGDPAIHPQVEEYWGNVNCNGIRSCYDEGKRMAETLCLQYHWQHSVQVRIARIFNTYGERMLENDGRIISNFITQALKGDDITVYGDGSQTRSFCYVADTVAGLIKLMEGDFMGPCNIGNPDEYTVLQLAQEVQKIVNPNAKILHMPLPSDDPTRRRPEISKAIKHLGWQPSTPLKVGLASTIAYFQKRIAARGDLHKQQ